MSRYSDFLTQQYREIYGRLIGTLIRSVYEWNGDQEYIKYVLAGFERFLRTKGFDIEGVMEYEIRRYYSKIGKADYLTVNAPQLDRMIKERFIVNRRQINRTLLNLKGDLEKIPKWATLLNADPNNLDETAKVGRRTFDKIREIGIDKIERSIMTGQRLGSRERAVLQDLHKLSQKGEIEVGQRTLKNIQVSSWEKLDNPNDYYFRLRTRSGQMRWYNVQDYAELVSRTTQKEAAYAAVIDRAGRSKEPLVAFSYRGIDYLDINDPCYKIDGSVFSTRKNYVASNGKIYPYLYDVVNKNYLVPHPNCKHTLGNVVDSPANLARLDAIAARNPDRVKAEAN